MITVIAINDYLSNNIHCNTTQWSINTVAKIKDGNDNMPKPVDEAVYNFFFIQDNYVGNGCLHRTTVEGTAKYIWPRLKDYGCPQPRFTLYLKSCPKSLSRCSPVITEKQQSVEKIKSCLIYFSHQAPHR